MKQIGDCLYTINETKQTVKTWEILEIDGDRYRCENKRTDRIREFSEGDPNVFDTEEEAMETIKKSKRKKNLVIGVYFGILAVITVIFTLFKIVTGTF